MGKVYKSKCVDCKGGDSKCPCFSTKGKGGLQKFGVYFWRFLKIYKEESVCQKSQPVQGDYINHEILNVLLMHFDHVHT